MASSAFRGRCGLNIDVSGAEEGTVLRPPRLDASRASDAGSGTDPTVELASLFESQDLVHEITKRFLHVNSFDADAAIDDALACLGGSLEIDRTYTFVFDGDLMDNTHEWCAPGITPEREHLQRVPIVSFAEWMGQLADGESVYIADVPGLPEERREEREHLASQGILSLLVVPLLSFGELVGLVGFDSVRTHREFHRIEIGLLRSLADVITSVLVRRRSEAKAELAEQRLAALTRYTTDFILIVDEGHRIAFASRSWDRLGLEPASMVGTPWQDFVHPSDVRSILRLTEPLATQQVAGRVIHLPDFRVRSVDDGWRWFAGSISDVRHDGVVDGMVVNAHDITTRRGVQDQLAHDALHDPLTGLGNRTLFTERLHAVTRRPPDARRSVAVAFLDLDRFKLVNDGHGHVAGDDVLMEVGRRLSQVIREGDTVARFGGDEFVVLLDGFDGADDVGQLIHRLQESLAPPVVVDGGNHYRVTASIGVAISTGGDAADILRDADTAMYQAKQKGRGSVVVFDETLRTKVLRRLTLLQRLPLAVEDDRIGVVFQPVVDVASSRVVGAEALARWDDDELGVVPPVEFVPIAEETGQLSRLGEWVLDRAIEAVTRWPEHMSVAVNLSSSQLTHPGLVATIGCTLDRYGVPASRLCVEVTESSLVHDPATAVPVLRELRQLGVRTALDDFGTGYSSLAMLRELPIDILKIDRVFVRGVHDDQRDRRLVDAVISLANDFGMDTLAEGVELAEQRDVLIDAGCAYAQGFLFGRPMPAEQLEPLLAAQVDRVDR